MKINESLAGEEKRVKDEKKMAEKNKLVFAPSKKQMQRSPPPRLQ